MADEETQASPPEQQEATETAPEKGKSGSMLGWIIIAVVALVGIGGGLTLGKLFAGPGNPQTPAQEQTSGESADEETGADAADSSSEDVWYYDLEPVVANLDEPGATRYVRAVLTLEMNASLNAEKGMALLEQKKPLLTNILTIYLAGLTVENARGDRNLQRIQSELCDAFNERLFANSKPLVNRILIKEFAVQ